MHNKKYSNERDRRNFVTHSHHLFLVVERGVVDKVPEPLAQASLAFTDFSAFNELLLQHARGSPQR